MTISNPRTILILLKTKDSIFNMQDQEEDLLRLLLNFSSVKSYVELESQSLGQPAKANLSAKIEKISCSLVQEGLETFLFRFEEKDFGMLSCSIPAQGKFKLEILVNNVNYSI